MAVERILSLRRPTFSGILTVFVQPAVIQRQRLGNMQLFARKEVVQARFMISINDILCKRLSRSVWIPAPGSGPSVLHVVKFLPRS